MNCHTPKLPLSSSNLRVWVGGFLYDQEVLETLCIASLLESGTRFQVTVLKDQQQTSEDTGHCAMSIHET